jgi:catechol 2,3-dioxygenase
MMSATLEQTQAQEGLFRPRRLGHANLFVGSYEKAAEFYNKIAGLGIVYIQPDNRSSFVSNGNTYHDLGLTDITSHYAQPGQKPGLNHIAFELETELDLVDGYNKAVAAGVKFLKTADHDAAHAVYKLDPDGNEVEIYADVVKDWRKVRSGVIIKQKPVFVPGVTSEPDTGHNYPLNPEIGVVEGAVFHPMRVTHAGMVTRDYAAMFGYYTRLVGLTPIVGDVDSPYAVLRGHYGNGDLTLYRGQAGLKPGLHHVGFKARSEADLDRSIEALKQTDVKLVRDISHPARRAVLIEDPDGLLLQFHVDRDWTPATIATISAEDALYLL